MRDAWTFAEYMTGEAFRQQRPMAWGYRRFRERMDEDFYEALLRSGDDFALRFWRPPSATILYPCRAREAPESA